MRALAGILFTVFCLFAVTAQDAVRLPHSPDPSDESSLYFTLGGSASFDGSLSTEETGVFRFTGSGFSTFASLSVNNDGKYSPANANLPGGTLGNNYFLINEGGMEVQFGGVGLKAGVLPQRDVLDSPYSLFINGTGRSATSAEISFEQGGFSYISRWIGLNHHSSNATAAFPTGYPERGANLKIYSIKVDDMTFGIEDAAVYSGRYFDFDYFADPMPNYFVQYVSGIAGRPWATGYEDNDIVGAFWTWENPKGFDLYAQVLVDDFNAYFLLPDTTPNNPWKAAWALGGETKTAIGTFGFHHGGATKYAFEPTYELAGREYGYAYYPDTVFLLSGDETAIPFEDMMIGYQHGENNIAFMGTWANDLADFDLAAALEFTLSGSKSPANAWQEPTWTDYTGTKMLDETVLEKKILFTFGAARDFGNFRVFAQAGLGYVFNELKLVSPVTPEPTTVGSRTWPSLGAYSAIGIWKPSDTNRFLYSISLGGKYRLEM